MEDGVVSSLVCTEVHNCYRFGALKLADYYSILPESNVSTNSSISPSSIVPWHICKGCTILVDLTKLKSKDDG